MKRPSRADLAVDLGPKQVGDVGTVDGCAACHAYESAGLILNSSFVIESVFSVLHQGTKQYGWHAYNPREPADDVGSKEISGLRHVCRISAGGFYADFIRQLH